jgi:hypothetical protein
MKYASDLTDSEWELIKNYFKKRDNRGSSFPSVLGNANEISLRAPKNHLF